MSSDAILRLLARAPTGTTGWPAAARAAGDLAALATAPAGRYRLPDGAAASRARAAIAARGTSRGPRPDTGPADLDDWRKWLAQPGHGLITLGAPDYPEQLAELPDAPLALWVDGTRPALLADPQVAIVGSRRASVGGMALARDFAETLGRAGLSVTSGLAAGIDGAAHAGALPTTGGTVAVLGCGIDRIYPERHATLAAGIRENGVIVSEYPPGTAPQPFRFPARNRIIAGLSLGTLVVEAAARSGSLITARLASDYGREVFAVPGAVHSTLSKGCHKLLRHGACLVEEVADVLNEIAPSLVPIVADAAHAGREKAPATLTPAEEKLLHRLDFSPVSITALAEDSGLTTQELSSMLLHLEIEGIIEALPGGRFSRLKRTR